MPLNRRLAAAGTITIGLILALAWAGGPDATSLAAIPQETAVSDVGYLPFLSKLTTPQPTLTPTPTATRPPGTGSPPPPTNGAIVVDHTSVSLFESIPEQYLTAARNLSMLFVDRSVGSNINDGLDCLTYAHTSAPNHCKRNIHPVSQFSVDPAEVAWAGQYPRPNWVYGSWPGSGIPNELDCGVSTGSWYDKLDCFIRYVDANPSQYQVYSYQNSYLEVGEDSDIASSITGYFVPQANRADITDLEALEARHPGLVFIYWTSSLSRGIGSSVSTDFNNQMRQYALAHGKILFDVADIEAHDPAANACVDNRDGVQYCTGNNCENYPDDGQAFPAICQHYTTETDGGHLGSVSAGKIRIAKAFWVLMAQIAGWTP